MTPRTRVLATSLLLGLFAATACGSDSGGSDGPFTLSSSPEHVNRMIPGRRPVALVSVAGEPGAAVTLTGSTHLPGAAVSLTPGALSVGAVAEVWLTVPERTDETPVSVSVTATRGKTTQTLKIDATAVPGTDDLAPTAGEIVNVFLRGLAGSVEGLPADAGGLTGGTPVAGLLVVTHYAWFTTEYEIGLSWHIMVAPDDWAELYLRPRGSLVPTKAYRLSSWSTALAGGEYTVTEVAPPAEVTR